MELKLLGRRGDHLCTPGDKSSVRQQGINQSGQGKVETEKKEEINTGAGQEPKVGEGMKSVNQKSGKRSKADRGLGMPLWRARQRAEPSDWLSWTQHQSLRINGLSNMVSGTPA